MRSTTALFVTVAFASLACTRKPENQPGQPAAQPAARAVAGPPAEVSPDEAMALMGGSEAVLLLDVRTPAEYAQGHVPGATLVPHDEVGARTEELKEWRDRPVLVYCESGRRAGLAAEALRADGFSDVALIAGSMKRWRDEERPVETAAP